VTQIKGVVCSDHLFTFVVKVYAAPTSPSNPSPSAAATPLCLVEFQRRLGDGFEFSQFYNAKLRDLKAVDPQSVLSTGTGVLIRGDAFTGSTLVCLLHVSVCASASMVPRPTSSALALAPALSCSSIVLARAGAATGAGAGAGAGGGGGGGAVAGTGSGVLSHVTSSFSVRLDPKTLDSLFSMSLSEQVSQAREAARCLASLSAHVRTRSPAFKCLALATNV
jgi:hypothetical protein